jgi:hypothetical protein
MEAASAMSMDRLFGKIKQLPTIPKLLHELMQSFNDENARIDEIAAKIAMDQVISVKVLRMANSAALRRGNEITSIEQAVIRLGFNRLRSGWSPPASSALQGLPALTSSTSDPDLPGRHQCPHPGTADHLGGSRDRLHLRPHSQHWRAADPEHPAGRGGLINLAIEKGSSRVDAQREMLGYDYAQLGAELARRWNPSPAFVDAIAQQLDPSPTIRSARRPCSSGSPSSSPSPGRPGVPAQAIIARFQNPG